MIAPEPLRALSVTQPWADCITRGEKLTENRTWVTRYRGPLAIHAGKRVNDAGLADARVQRLLCGRTGPDCWDRGLVPSPPWSANRGVIVAMVDLVDCHAAWRGCCQPWGDPEAWHWVLDSVQRLPQPIPLRGRLGVFVLPDDVATLIGDQLQAVAR